MMPAQSNKKDLKLNANIPVPVKTCLRLLLQAGFEAWLVGGCVRDFLMGRDPKDYDIATSARAEDMKNVFADYRVIETGLVYGTLTIISDGYDIEITTFRTESSYEDSRHPSSVTFVFSLSEDLLRRDFTMNALAMDIEGLVVDEVGGVNDILARKIRVVGEAQERFEEDPLRIMRALRFASELEFDIDIATLSAMKLMHSRLSDISSERIHTEFEKMLCASGVSRVMILGQEIIQNLFSAQEILRNYRYPSEDIAQKAWSLAARAVGSVRCDFSVRLGVLSLMADYFIECSDSSSVITSDIAEADKLRGALTINILSKLKCGRNVKKDVLSYADIFGANLSGDDYYFRTLINRHGEKILVEYSGILRKLAEAELLPSRIVGDKPDTVRSALAMVDEIVARGDCCSLSCLAVNGEDIMNLGVPRGKVIAEVLARCLDRVLKNPGENRRDRLIEFAKSQIDMIKYR